MHPPEIGKGELNAGRQSSTADHIDTSTTDLGLKALELTGRNLKRGRMREGRKESWGTGPTCFGTSPAGSDGQMTGSTTWEHRRI